MKNNHILPFFWMRGESEEIIRKEMEKVDECGIGAVCLEARPHEEFCKEGWWHDVDIVIDEAKKRDMKIWILDDKHFPTGYANGLIKEKYPERKKLYIAYSKTYVYGYPDRPLSLDLSRMLKPAIGFWEIPNALKNMEERAKNKLLSVTAVRSSEGNILHEETIDLTDKVVNNIVEFSLPKGVWAVYVIFKTRTDGGDDTYINLIDEVSAHTQIEGVYEAHYERYKDEFGKTIAGFFSDEPQFGNLDDFGYDTCLGKKKMHLPWSDELEEMIKERYGSDYTEYLPFLFQDTEECSKRDRIRYDYMDCVSLLYKKNFSEKIGRWCEDHGVEYIGHVVEENGIHSRLGMGAVHWFRAMSGQHMAGIDDIGEQVQLGNPYAMRQAIGELGGDGEFHHFTLGKLGASAGHLDPKKKGRVMCEIFGAYGWNFGVRDMKYVLDHFLVKGINELVPHAFSMADYPDEDCPPHFYAHGNNPQFPYFARLMKYANRVCELLSKGQHTANAAILYDAEGDWIADGMRMQKPARQLTEHQIDFDFVPMDYLEELESYNGRIKGDKLIINGVTFDVLIISYMKAIPEHFAQWIIANPQFPVLFVNDYPGSVMGTDGTTIEGVKAVSEVVALEDIAGWMKEKGFCEISIDRYFPQLSTYHYVKDGNIYAIQNESAYETFKGTISLPSSGKLLVYNGFDDTYEAIPQTNGPKGTRIELELAPVECLYLVEDKGQKCEGEYIPYRAQIEGLKEEDLSKDWDVSSVRSIDYPAFSEAEHKSTLDQPFSVENPTFSGIIRYSKDITFDAVPEKAVIKADNVYELMRILVNSEEAGYRLTPPYQIDITDKLKAGVNRIDIEVITTPAREQLVLPRPPFDFGYEAMEATGMYGKVTMYTK